FFLFLLVLQRLARLHTFVLVDDDLELVRRDRRVEFDWVVLARFGQGRVFSLIKLFRRLLDFTYPGVEIFLSGGDSLEFHTGETGTAVVGGDTVHFSVAVSDQVQLGLHARHRVDLAAQAR